jgi:uncharacterized RDD family membrane protein YckC
MNQPAGFWIRLLALIIDAILFGLFRMALGFIFTVIGVMREPTEVEQQILQKIAQDGGGPAELFGASLKIAQETGTFIGSGVFIVLTTILTVLFVAYKGGTPGKLALGLRVRMANADAKPSVWRAFLREVIGKGFLWPLTLGIGAFIVAFNKKKRGLHDVAAGTIVVKTADE